MKLAKFFISSTRHIFTKLLSVSESSTKGSVKLGTFPNLLTLAVICKQRRLHGNEIVQYLQNCKRYNIEQNHFRKPL